MWSSLRYLKKSSRHIHTQTVCSFHSKLYLGGKTSAGSHRTDGTARSWTLLSQQSEQMERQGLASGSRGREWAQLLLLKAFFTHPYSFRAEVQFYPLHLLIRESLPGSENIAKYMPLPRNATGCHRVVTVPEDGVQLSPLGSPCCSAVRGPVARVKSRAQEEAEHCCPSPGFGIRHPWALQPGTSQVT